MTVKPIVADLSYEDGDFHVTRLIGEDITHVVLAAFADGADFAEKNAGDAHGAEEAMEEAFDDDTAFVDDSGFPQRWTAGHGGLPVEIALSLGLAAVPDDLAGMFDAWAAAARAGGIETVVLQEKRKRVVEAFETAMRVESLEGDRDVLNLLATAIAKLPGGVGAMAAAVREGGSDPVESIAAARSLAEV